MFRGGGGGGGRRGGRYAAVDVEAPASSGAAGGKPKPKPSFLVQHGAQLKLLLPYMWPAEEPRLKVLLVLAVACLLASKAFNIAVPLMLKQAVDDVSHGRLPIGSVVRYGLFRFLTSAAQEGRDCCFGYVSAYASRRISLKVFTHVQNLSLRFHLNRKTGAVLRATSRGSAAFADLLRYLSFQIAPIFLEVGIVSVYLFASYRWPFGLITSLVMASYVTATIVVTEWRNKYRRQATEADDAFNQRATDALLNFETVILFSAQDHIGESYDASLGAVAAASIDSQLSLSALNCCQNGIISFGVGLAMYLAGQEVYDGTMSVGDFVLIQVFILQLYAPLGFLGTYWRMIKQSMVDVEAMLKLLGEEQEVKDEPSASELRVGRTTNVVFEKVVFSFEPSRPPLLRGVDLEAHAGQKLAVVGSSGAGKSTLTRLLFRLYNVASGRILIAGCNIAQYTQRSVRMAIAVVPQDTVLFNDSLLYNVSLGKLAKGELASEAEVRQALEQASLSDFVKRQPKGLETVVGERGLRLSGGEKQRVAIARALLKDAPIFVSDEATSALDSRTEKDIMGAIDSAAKGRTYITIAHRLSTVADADAIAVLDGGVVAELGTHAELLARNGLYAALWRRHAREAAKEEQAAVTDGSAGADAEGSTSPAPT